jgi:hypothetical protein
MLLLNSTSLSLNYESGIGNRESGIEKVEKAKIFIHHALCSHSPRFVIAIRSESSLAKMLIYIPQRRKERVENQDFCKKFNDFYFLGIVNPQ